MMHRLNRLLIDYHGVVTFACFACAALAQGAWLWPRG
jgi:hypothetical protein